MALRYWQFAIVAAVVSSTARAQNQPIDMSLATITGSQTGSHESAATVSLGSVGPDNRTTGSYAPERGGDQYYFNIPSQRPFPGAPGITLHIPLEDDSTR
jgi:hypothetical protein